MRLSDVIKQLAKNGINKIGTWKFRNRNGITLGDPAKYFPYPTGPRYQIDTTEDPDPDLEKEEIKAIERRFNIDVMM